MIKEIELAIKKIDELGNGKPIKIISHFDTDGITSAAIFSRAMQKWGKQFSLEIVKGLDRKFIESLSDENVLIFLDLGSGSLEQLGKKKTEVFIFDHHEIVQEIPENVFVVNPVLDGHEPISAAAVCYLFAKTLSLENKSLASLAVIGMVGDLQEKNIGKFFDEIIKDSESIVKKGLLIYPSTRPLNRALEYSSNPYIPGVTGSREGVMELLRDAGVGLEGGRFKALYELNDAEMTRLITAVMLRVNADVAQENIIGNLFLIKFFNKLEDARELSALINACSRMDYPEVALGFCLGNKSMKVAAEKVYISYRHDIVSALKYVSDMEKICGRNYVIINARDKIKDTIIGTVASILSHSSSYKEGLIVVTLAYRGDDVKVSGRVVGSNGRNVRELLERAISSIGSEVGGHPNAAGCLVPKEREEEFIGELVKVLDVELVKV